MSSVPINVFLWKANKEDLALAKTIISVIEKYAEVELHAKIDDLSIVEANNDLDNPCLAFGDMAKRQYSCCGANWILPEISKLQPDPNNRSIREEAFERMKEIGQQLAVITKNDIETQAHVEMETGTTIGKINTDILITEQEAQYLIQLKELLGGSKIIVIKDDIKIEVE